jgi:hypothetical protein
MTQQYTPPVKRVQRGKNHHYQDAQGHRIPGVTTILGNGIPKPALINWAANATAEYAVDHWDQLGDLAVAARLKTLQGARYETSDKAKKRGTEVHELGERLVKGEAVKTIPEELRGHCEAYVRFLDQFHVEPVLVEVVVVSYKYGYAGTLDLVADLATGPDGASERWLLDLKTNEKGIFGETALQLAAYRYAEKYLDDNGVEQDMPRVERTGAILIGSDNAQLIPTESSVPQLKQFWYASQVAEFAAGSRDLIGAPIEPRDPDAPFAHIAYKDPRELTEDELVHIQKRNK